MYFPYMATKEPMLASVVGFGVGSTLVTLAIMMLGYDKE